MTFQETDGETTDNSNEIVSFGMEEEIAGTLSVGTTYWEYLRYSDTSHFQ